MKASGSEAPLAFIAWSETLHFVAKNRAQASGRGSLALNIESDSQKSA
jgi:hypothetical protein